MRAPPTSSNGENNTPLSFISCVLSMPVTLGTWLFHDNDSNNNDNGTMNDTKTRTKEGTLIFDRESTVISGAAPPGSMYRYRDHHDGTFYRGGGDQNNVVTSSRQRGLYPEDTSTTGTTSNDTKKRKKTRTSTRKNSLNVGSPESQGPDPARYY